jgi:hypothetical protein
MPIDVFTIEMLNMQSSSVLFHFEIYTLLLIFVTEEPSPCLLDSNSRTSSLQKTLYIEDEGLIVTLK